MPNGFLIFFFFFHIPCCCCCCWCCLWGCVAASTKLPRIMLRSFYPLFANQKNYVFISGARTAKRNIVAQWMPARWIVVCMVCGHCWKSFVPDRGPENEEAVAVNENVEFIINPTAGNSEIWCARTLYNVYIYNTYRRAIKQQQSSSVDIRMKNPANKWVGMHKKAETIFFLLLSVLLFPFEIIYSYRGGHICNYFIMISNYSDWEMVAADDVGSFLIGDDVRWMGIWIWELNQSWFKFIIFSFLVEWITLFFFSFDKFVKKV